MDKEKDLNYLTEQLAKNNKEILKQKKLVPWGIAWFTGFSLLLPLFPIRGAKFADIFGYPIASLFFAIFFFTAYMLGYRIDMKKRKKNIREIEAKIDKQS